MINTNDINKNEPNGSSIFKLRSYTHDSVALGGLWAGILVYDIINYESSV